MRSTFARLTFFVALLIALTPASALAQAGAIAGVVRDTTGAVLPGVTVEAASPALIEKVRSAVTGENGQYRIIDLRPGTYSVTFTLPGFTTVKSDGITLAAGFTAPVNAEMQVGGVAETVVVSGVNPVVDIQNVRTQQVLTREMVDVLPTAKAFQQIAKIVPAIQGDPDVGGTSPAISPRVTAYGGRANDQALLINGLSVTGVQFGAGSTTLTTLSDAMVDQTVFEAAGHSAEAETGGVVVNVLPKAGGNTFTGSAFGSFTTTDLQSNNISAALRARGLSTPNPVDFTSDVSGNLGGPLVRDKLWFFGAFRDLRSSQFVSNRFPNRLPTDGWRYIPNTDVQPTDSIVTKDGSGHVSWQVSPRNKIGVFAEYTPRGQPHFIAPAPASLEATWNSTQLTRIVQVLWTMPATNRLLFDAGFSIAKLRFLVRPQPDAVGPSAFDLGIGTLFRSLMCGPCSSNALTYRNLFSDNYVFRASMSYVTGAHAVKIGLTVNPGTADFFYFTLADYEVRVLNGSPVAAVFLPTPLRIVDSLNKVAVFAQDQWTMNRLTLNLGARFDWFKTHYPDVNLPATNILPRRDFPGAEVLNWRDLSPRVGVSYDLFGDSKTALKASLSRYVLQEGTDLTRAVDPAVASGGTLQRTWNDNGDFVPQGDPLNPAANGELGPSPNNKFGTLNPTIRYDSNWSSGFAVRPNLWEMSAGVEREIASGVSASAMYFRRWYGNFPVTENQAVAPSDFSTYCIVTPADSRLPGGGGQQICGLYDISPSKLGQLDNVGTSSEAFGKQTEVWRGVDLAFNARLRSGVFIQGGVSTGKTVTDNCAIVTNFFNQVSTGSSIGTAQSTEMCRLETPFLTQIKVSGSLMLPLGIQVSGLFQSVPGNAVAANFVATNAAIRPSLGRDLAAGPRQIVTVNILAPGTRYGDRQNQADLRLARTFTIRKARLKGMIDLYNVTNSNPVLSWNNTYGTTGASWLLPLSILPGRLLKFGAQFDF